MNLSDTLSLYVPVPDLIKPVYEEMLLKDPETPFPFWAQIWPSAKAMVSFLKENPDWVFHKNVLEMGAGIGLPSFSIVALAREVIMSDLSMEAVSLIEKNIHHLALKNAKAMCIDWKDFPENKHAEVLLLSDINYAPNQFKSLLKMIHHFIEQGTLIILATPQRVTITPFAEALKPFIQKSVLQTVVHLNQLVEIRLLMLSK